MELNAEQIIRGLESCTRGRKSKEDMPCLDCPYNECNVVGGTNERQIKGTCQGWLMKDSLALVKQLTEENESLKTENEQWRSDWSENQKRWEIAYDTQECAVRADTVREMQERIKTRCIKSGIYPAIVARAIDQVAKEMTEEEQ